MAALYAMAFGSALAPPTPSMGTFVDLEPIPRRRNSSLRDRFGHDPSFCKRVEKRRKRNKNARASRRRNRR